MAEEAFSPDLSLTRDDRRCTRTDRTHDRPRYHTPSSVLLALYISVFKGVGSKDQLLDIDVNSCQWSASFLSSSYPDAIHADAPIRSLLMARCSALSSKDCNLEILVEP